MGLTRVGEGGRQRQVVDYKPEESAQLAFASGDSKNVREALECRTWPLLPDAFAARGAAGAYNAFDHVRIVSYSRSSKHTLRLQSIYCTASATRGSVPRRTLM